MFYVHNMNIIKNQKLKIFISEVSGANIPVNIISMSNTRRGSVKLKPKSFNNSEKSCKSSRFIKRGIQRKQNKVDKYLESKEIEIENKEEELRLLQDKICQVEIIKRGKIMEKTPSFSNISKIKKLKFYF